MDKKEILAKRFSKLESHYRALREYKMLIDDMLVDTNIYDQFTFNTLKPEKKTILGAYLESYYLNALHFSQRYTG